MLSRMKDTALSKGAQVAINTQIKEYGEVLKLNVDSKQKSLEMEVILDGEKEPLAVHVQNYKMSEEGGRHYLEVHSVSTSRDWINTVASTYLEGKRFEIPAEYARLLKVVL